MQFHTRYARSVTDRGQRGEVAWRGEIRAISLDLFDTLVDLRWDVGSPSSTPLLHREVASRSELSLDDFTAVLAEVDGELRAPRYAQGIEVPTVERFERLAARLAIPDPDLPDRLTEIHMGAIREKVVVPRHHVALLHSLRQRVRVGHCSNFSHAATAHRILEENELASKLDAVVISEEVGFRKPRPEIFEALLSSLSVSPEQTLHVGDRLTTDVGGAAALCMRTAWITRCVRDPERALDAYDGPRPDWIVSDLDQLPDLF